MGKLKWFYREALGLDPLPRPRMTGDPESGQGESGEWGDTAAFFEAGNRTELQIHATMRRPYASYEYDQSVNPLVTGGREADGSRTSDPVVACNGRRERPYDTARRGASQ